MESFRDLYELDERHPVADAVMAIRGGGVQTTQGGHLQLVGKFWPSATNSVLFVRECYEALYTHMFRRLQPAAGVDDESLRLHRFVVTGQEGIGKSVFVWYVIKRVLLEQADRAIIHVDDTQHCYIITPGEPVRWCSLEQLQNIHYIRDLVALNPVLISDSYIPPVLPFATLPVASRYRLRRADSEVVKVFAPWLYMPVPSAQEVLQLRAAAFGHEPEAAVIKRMEVFGPIPRSVLVRTSAGDQLSAWERAPKVCLNDGAGMPYSTMWGERNTPYRILLQHCLGQDSPAGSAEADMCRSAYWRCGDEVPASNSTMTRDEVERMVRELAQG